MIPIGMPTVRFAVHKKKIRYDQPIIINLIDGVSFSRTLFAETAKIQSIDNKQLTLFCHFLDGQSLSAFKLHCHHNHTFLRRRPTNDALSDSSYEGVDDGSCDDGCIGVDVYERYQCIRNPE